MPSQFPSTSTVHQPVHQQQAPTAPSRSVGAIESVINRVQRNMSSFNPSPMRNQGVVEGSNATPYKVAYQQHAGKKRAVLGAINGRQE